MCAVCVVVGCALLLLNLMFFYKCNKSTKVFKIGLLGAFNEDLLSCCRVGCGVVWCEAVVCCVCCMLYYG